MTLRSVANIFNSKYAANVQQNKMYPENERASKPSRREPSSAHLSALQTLSIVYKQPFIPDVAISVVTCVLATSAPTADRLCNSSPNPDSECRQGLFLRNLR